VANNDLAPKITKFLIIWFFKLLWRFVRWLAMTIYYRFLPDHMCIAPSKEAVENFYKSRKWYRLSLETKNRYGRKCMKCFKSPESYPGLKLNTDHIKPLWYYWHKRLDPNNMQVLCANCNKAKGSVDMTDYRGYRPGKEPLPETTPVPRRQLQIASTPHLRQRGWGD
jgi:hypothetical protein